MAIERPEEWRFSLLGKSSNYCWVIFQQAMFEDSGGYTLSYGNVDRRKFRSQISDNMNRWKSRGGKSQRRERVSRKNIRKEKESEERRCETLFFQCFVAPESRKVGSLKRRVRSHLQRRDDNLHAVVARSTFERQNGKNTSCSEHFWKFQCLKSTPLWREARLEVEPCKTKHVWGTFGS